MVLNGKVDHILLFVLVLTLETRASSQMSPWSSSSCFHFLHQQIPLFFDCMLLPFHLLAFCHVGNLVADLCASRFSFSLDLFVISSAFRL